MVQEGAVEGTADGLIPTEAEGDVGDTATDLRARADALDLAGGADEVNGIVVVLGHARANGEDVRIKDDIIWVEANILNKDAIGPLAHANLGIKYKRNTGVRNE